MINNNIKLQQLRHFIVTVETGKVSTASIVLGIAQPALSQSIKNLELTLDAKLFRRTKAGVLLTEAGTLFYPKIKKIINNLKEAQEDLKSLINEPYGKVKIFLSPKLASHICIRLYKLMLLKHPKIELEFEEGFGLRGSNLIENGEVDLGILPDWKFNKNINSKLIISDNLYFYGKKNINNNTNKPIKFNDLINYPLILTGAQVILRQKLIELSKKLDGKLQIITESNSQAYTQSFINDGLAYSIGPAEASYNERKENIFFAREIIEPKISRSVVISWPKVKTISYAAKITSENILIILNELHQEQILAGNFIYKKTKINFDQERY